MSMRIPYLRGSLTAVVALAVLSVGASLARAEGGILQDFDSLVPGQFSAQVPEWKLYGAGTIFEDWIVHRHDGVFWHAVHVRR